MQIIKLSATDSTNDYLKRLCAESSPENGTVVWADFQEKGRGQKDRVWHSESGKNLCISILQELGGLAVKDQFTINCAVSMACIHSLEQVGIQQLRIKWPNDIMAGNLKIGGILIENIVKGKSILRSIIGIGINVNQMAFEGLPNATSILNLTGQTYSRSELLDLLLPEIEKAFANIDDKGEELRQEYIEHLYLLHREGSFYDKDGKSFNAVVRGVGTDGKLHLQTNDGIREFNMTEISMDWNQSR